MRLHIYTLALDAMPFMPIQLRVFESLKCDWVWHVIEGAADNLLDTGWCAKITPRFSRDGTSEWLTSQLKHPNIRIYRRQLWPGKTAMVNAALSTINEECVLMQIDSDELWTAEKIGKIMEVYETGQYDRMRFFCRYFVGPKIVTVGTNCWSNNEGEWSRSWRFKPGMIQKSHEPPILQGCGTMELSRNTAKDLGLVFEHFAYVLPKQIAFKEVYYKYRGAVDQWNRLQANTEWPVDLKKFLPWVGSGVTADLFENIYPGEINPATTL